MTKIILSHQRLLKACVLSILLLLGMLAASPAHAQCQSFNGKLVATPNPICAGMPVNVNYVGTNYPMQNNIINWSYNGTASTVIPNPPLPYWSCKIVSVTTTGTAVATGTAIISGVRCPFTITVQIRVNDVTANAGADMPITPAPGTIVIGGAPSATGGATPYNYAWAPTAAITPTAGQTAANPTVMPSFGTTYTLTVTDAMGCISTDMMTFYLTYSYGELQRVLDGGFYQVYNGKLYFTIDREYSNAAQLKYKIYDEWHILRTDYSVGGMPALAVQRGDNRFLLDLSSGTLGYTATDNNKFFTLEVTNEKNELFFLKFKYAQ